MSEAQAHLLAQNGIAALALIGYAWGGLDAAIAVLIISFLAGLSTAFTHKTDNDS